MTLENLVEVSNLTKYYGELLAVDHINFSVRRGEVFGFLGPNGAGKTTTIRMLTGLSRPTDGTARIMGYDIMHEALYAKEHMGIVPETSNIYDEYSAWNNLVFTGRLYGVPKREREQRAIELLKMFGLYEKRDEKVQGFSKGMKRRVCIAMALINEPEILFLDEPTTGLDVQSVLVIKNLVRRLNREKTTIFLTTHNIEEASQLCERVAIIDKGRIAAIDSPEGLKKNFECTQCVEVSFDRASSHVIEDLEGLPSVNEVRKQGDKFRLYTADPSLALSKLWEYAASNSLKIVTLNTVGPTLEDVFVKMTGIGLKA